MRFNCGLINNNLNFRPLFPFIIIINSEVKQRDFVFYCTFKYPPKIWYFVVADVIRVNKVTTLGGLND